MLAVYNMDLSIRKEGKMEGAATPNKQNTTFPANYILPRAWFTIVSSKLLKAVTLQASAADDEPDQFILTLRLAPQ